MEEARARVRRESLNFKAQTERDLAAKNAEMDDASRTTCVAAGTPRRSRPEMEEARARVRRESLNFKAQAERDLAAQNAEMRRRIAEAMEHGRDAKSLSPEAEAGRAAVAARSREEKDAAAGRLADENLATAVRLTEAMRHGRDAKSLSPETRAYRRAVAEKSRTDKAAAEARASKGKRGARRSVGGDGQVPGSVLLTSGDRRRETTKEMGWGRQPRRCSTRLALRGGQSRRLYTPVQLLHGEKHTLARSTRGLRRTQKRLYPFLAAIPVKRSNIFCVTSYVVDTELAPRARAKLRRASGGRGARGVACPSYVSRRSATRFAREGSGVGAWRFGPGHHYLRERLRRGAWASFGGGRDGGVVVEGTMGARLGGRRVSIGGAHRGG